MNYGRQVLTHPWIVEAAQTLFVPACVYNNTKDDADAAVLKAFKERAWNNPVVRITTHDKKDIIRRHAGDWSLAGLANAMVEALANHKSNVPQYLRLLATETAARKRGVGQAAFGMT